MAARPYAPTAVRTRVPAPVTTPPIAPVDPFAGRADPFAGLADPFAGLAADPFRAADPFAAPKPDPFAVARRDPFRKRPGKKKRTVIRHHVILPTLGPQRRSQGLRYCMPYEAVEHAYEMGSGEVVLQGGHAEDFDEVAIHHAMAVGCSCMDWNSVTCRIETVPEADRTYDCTGEHEAFAVRMDVGENPLPMVDTSHLADYAYGSGSDVSWSQVREWVLRARAHIDQAPSRLFQHEHQIDTALSVLSLAGFSPASGGYQPEEIVAMVLDNWDDPGVRAAGLDMGSLAFADRVPGLQWLEDEWERLYEADVDIVGPDTFQFLYWTADQLEVEPTEACAPVTGVHEATDATYHSMLDGTEDIPWAFGWREITMKKMD